MLSAICLAQQGIKNKNYFIVQHIFDQIDHLMDDMDFTVSGGLSASKCYVTIMKLTLLFHVGMSVCLLVGSALIKDVPINETRKLIHFPES